MPSWPGICGCSSMFILTSLTFPPAALTAFSITGVSCLHGPHHGAQKSTSTGCLADSAITSWRNPAVVVSLTRLSAAAALSASMRTSRRLIRELEYASRWDGGRALASRERRLRQRRHTGRVSTAVQELDEVVPRNR